MSCPRGDQDMPADPQLAVDFEGIRAYEPGKPVKGVNPEMSVARLLFCWHRVREGSFESDEFRPFDADIALDAVTAHPLDTVDPLRAADQHLLRIASPQRAGSAEWAVIDDSYRPASRARTGARHLGGRAAANNNQIIAVVHRVAPSMEATGSPAKGPGAPGPDCENRPRA